MRSMSREWRGFGGVEREKYEQGVAWVWRSRNEKYEQGVAWVWRSRKAEV